LRLAGRAKWVVKTAGYLVYPGDVEAHIAMLAGQVANVGVVGQPHARWGEALVAFVEKLPSADLSEAALRRHARAIASYMRPLHYVILAPGAMPLNRTGKVDTLRLQHWAGEEVQKLRSRGRWDG
ncbi:MAG: long-chain fatty acid--CoA ligase, partial [Bryobacteraceae bacterium]